MGIKECVDLCWECRTDCQKTLFNYCLLIGGIHADAAHVKLMLDCIQSCQITADFMVRKSEMHAEQCAACAAVCEACAESCEKIGGIEMEKCASICHKCADSCRDMSGMKKAA